MIVERGAAAAEEAEALAPPHGEREPAARVRRRHVLYLHGFDPAASDRYRRLIERAATAWAAASPQRVTPAFGQVARITDVSEGWRIDAFDGVERVETTFEILRYEDVVRQWRGRPKIPALFGGLASWGEFAFGGGLLRCWRLAKGPAALFLYPALTLFGFAALGWIAGGLAAGLLSLLGAPGWGFWASILGAIGGLALSYRAERALFAHLMLSLFDFMIRIARDAPPAGRLTLREAEFADRIAALAKAEAAGEVDELLIVGHSLGGFVAVSALARAFRRSRALAEGRARVSLLTLGSVAGYVACRGGPGAEAFGEAVGRVAAAPNVDWVDVSSPRDWFSFGLVDPLLLTDAPPPSARSPLVVSAKFGPHAPDPDDRRTKFGAMSLHMRYLSPPEAAGGFDVVPLLVGPDRLAQAFAGRRRSPKARMRAS
ncbi:MAG: hypothetical protein AAGF90_14205 [Pseudomonadota bacterium]